MAGKRRTSSLGHMTDIEQIRIQDTLDSFASDEYYYREDGNHAAARKEAAKREGALVAAAAIGLKCSCFPVTKKMIRCACGLDSPSLANRKKSRIASYRLFLKQPLLEGAHCRDSQGDFVPVPQCRRTKRKTVPKGLSGVHCRDSQGLFVPVPQCLRKRRK